MRRKCNYCALTCVLESDKLQFVDAGGEKERYGSNDKLEETLNKLANADVGLISPSPFGRRAGEEGRS
jgi:hypothetical protein